jgi:hypothetical protein
MIKAILTATIILTAGIFSMLKTTSAPVKQAPVVTISKVLIDNRAPLATAD